MATAISILALPFLKYIFVGISEKPSSFNLPVNLFISFLFNKKEINKLTGKINAEGYTLVPTKMYFKKGKAKLEIAVAKGKKQYDKRQTKKNRDWNRDKARYFRKSS